MKNSSKIHFYNRYTKKEEVENVYGDSMVRLVYEKPLGKVIGNIISKRPLSKMYGHIQDHTISKNKIPEFVNLYKINMDDYEKGSLNSEIKSLSYKSFNEFFIRKFKNGKRKVIDDLDRMPAPAEARYYGHSSLSNEVRLPVKGNFLRPVDLLSSSSADSKFAKVFESGPFLIARLCPVDYHRYHYPDDGITKESYTIKGSFHSVNPIALKKRPNIFMTNERRVSLLETKNFGRLAYIEVGAVCVGKIVQSHNEDNAFKRGDEKGYFLFGGSTVIVLGEKNAWRPSEDIIKNTSEGIETYIHFGDEVAIKDKS